MKDARAYLLALIFSPKTLALATCQAAVNAGAVSIAHTASSKSGYRAHLSVRIEKEEIAC